MRRDLVAYPTSIGLRLHWIKALRIIYLFIDGIGFGEPNHETNPFTRFATSYLAPLGHSAEKAPTGWLHAQTDAHMGLEGLPQSATGQTSLWTGINGPNHMGHHKTGFPGPTLIRVIQEFSIVKRVVEAGKKATLLNAYSDKYHERIRKHPRLTSASTHVQMASGQALKNLDDLENDQAMFMDVTHSVMHRFFPEQKDRFPVRDPVERGRDLVRMSRPYDLTLYEYFLTDKAGHAQDFELAQMCIETLEAFLTGIAQELDPKNELLLLTSDHGNLEDLSTKSHTHNKVPTFALGERSTEVPERIKALTDIAPFIYDCLNIDAPLPAFGLLPEPAAT